MKEIDFSNAILNGDYDLEVNGKMYDFTFVGKQFLLGGVNKYKMLKALEPIVSEHLGFSVVGLCADELTPDQPIVSLLFEQC